MVRCRLRGELGQRNYGVVDAGLVEGLLQGDRWCSLRGGFRGLILCETRRFVCLQRVAETDLDEALSEAEVYGTLALVI